MPTKVVIIGGGFVDNQAAVLQKPKLPHTPLLRTELGVSLPGREKPPHPWRTINEVHSHHVSAVTLVLDVNDRVLQSKTASTEYGHVIARSEVLHGANVGHVAGLPCRTHPGQAFTTACAVLTSRMLSAAWTQPVTLATELITPLA